MVGSKVMTVWGYNFFSWITFASISSHFVRFIWSDAPIPSFSKRLDPNLFISTSHLLYSKYIFLLLLPCLFPFIWLDCVNVTHVGSTRDPVELYLGIIFILQAVILYVPPCNSWLLRLKVGWIEYKKMLVFNSIHFF